jgi:hypothetical protein
LLQVVPTLHGWAGLANAPDGWEKQANHDRDKGDEDEEFDQSESAAVGASHG